MRVIQQGRKEASPVDRFCEFHSKGQKSLSARLRRTCWRRHAHVPRACAWSASSNAIPVSSASTRGRPLVDLHAYQLPARDAILAAEMRCVRITPTPRACTGRLVDSRAIDRKIAGLMRPSVDRFRAPTGAASGSPEVIISSLLALSRRAHASATVLRRRLTRRMPRRQLVRRSARSEGVWAAVPWMPS